MYKIKHTELNDIKGWLSEAEAEALFECALTCPINRVLELGSFVGKSTIVLAKAMEERDGLVFAFDIFNNNQKFKEDIVVKNTLKEFWENISKHQVSGNVIALRGDHKDLLDKISGKWGMIFIDGGHDFLNTLLNGRYAWNNVRKGGYIAFHDYHNTDTWGGVKEAVDVLLTKWGVEIYKEAGSIAIIKK